MSPDVMFCAKNKSPVVWFDAIVKLLVGVKGFIDDDRIPALNVSSAVAVSAIVFLKYNKFAFAIVNVCASEFDASKTSLSKIGRSSVGGKYDAIINK